MSEEERVFSVEEADARLGDLALRLVRIQEARHRLMEAAERIREAVVVDGGGHGGREYFDAMDVLRGEIEHFAGEGIVLRDPETGLIDFPSERDGRRIFLCWRLGEDRVRFWHDPESGFAGRRPL